MEKIDPIIEQNGIIYFDEDVNKENNISICDEWKWKTFLDKFVNFTTALFAVFCLY